MAGIVAYSVFMFAAGNDIMAVKLGMSINDITRALQIGLFVLPPLAFWVTKRICLSLQRRDRDSLEHGYESGIIQQLPSGEFVEVHKENSDETVHVLESKPVITSTALDEDETNEKGGETPAARKPMGKFRRALAHWYTKDNVSFEGVPAHTEHHPNNSADGDDKAH